MHFDNAQTVHASANLDAQPHGSTGRRALVRHRTLLLLLLLIGATALAISTAMLRNSMTFDEIVMIAGGARGYETDNWQIAPEHPPFVQYLYGLPVYLSGPNYPDESAVSPRVQADRGYRYRYAQMFFWESGNDPERLAALGRIPALLCALGLVLIVFFHARRIGGDAVGLLAAALTATLPDVLAHGGVAYNDVPIALAFLAAVWAIDEALRRPTAPRAALAGGLIAVSLATKNSAIALAPIGLMLLIAEAVVRRADAAWRRDLLRAAAVVLATTYLGLVLVYRGDHALAEYRYAIDFVISQVTQQGTPAFLLGATTLGGWWHFFPVAFLFKTSAGLHVLLVLAAVALGVRCARQPRRLLGSRLRAPLVAFIIFGALLMRSDLNIGFRYALPALPLLCIMVAAGVMMAWRESGRVLRALIIAATVWTGIHTASHYPYFLSYISEYGPGRDENHTVLIDSSLDWGQGLLALRDFMREADIPVVYLSYFGSALPAGYGIEHVPLASFFPLPPRPQPAESPAWVAISATNLSGGYLANDPFADFRRARPDHVAANTIYLYRIRE